MRNDIEERFHFAPFAKRDMKQRIADKADRDTVHDAVHERNERDDKERGKGFFQPLEGNIADGGHHQAAIKMRIGATA